MGAQHPTKENATIEASYILTSAQNLAADPRAAVTRLISLCNAYEGLDLKLDLNASTSEDAHPAQTNCFFVHHGDALVGYAALDRFDPVIETCGMVHPDHRRRGIGRALLAAAQAEVRRSAGHIVLICEDQSASGQGFLQAITTELRFKEHRLMLTTLPVPRQLPSDLHLTAARPEDAETFAGVLATAFGDPLEQHLAVFRAQISDSQQRFYLACLGDQPIAALKVVFFGDRAGIYAFGVVPVQRNRGWGRLILGEIIARTLAVHLVAFFIEVETDNAPALHLYQACGFVIQTTYGYYRVPEDR